MTEIVIRGGRPLEGALRVQGAKNSVLPVLAATILHNGDTIIKNCPRLSDVEASIHILQHLGAVVRRRGSELTVHAAGLDRWDVPDHLMREMRSSVIFLGALLARFGRAEMSYPGGCELGPRPIDLHLAALEKLGAELREDRGLITCRRARLRGGEITLALPSVGATENTMLAACGAAGETVIVNAAREPEIVDLQSFLRAMGFEVRGAGSSVISVGGRRETVDTVHRVMGDRIAAATYLSAAAAAGGEVVLQGVERRHMSTVVSVLRQAGCRVTDRERGLCLESDGKLRSAGPVRTAPYPGFPTDAQPVVMAALLRSAGSTVFVENMFENRYRHVDELRRMGADISVADRVAVVTGVKDLRGAPVRAGDLRGGAALLVAALSARGESRVEGVSHILRGYEDPVGDLRLLGAEVSGT